MFKFLEKKTNNTIGTFTTIGVLCVILGVAVLVNEFFWRVFVAIIFFILAYVAFHIACRIKYIRNTFLKIFPFESNHQRKYTKRE